MHCMLTAQIIKMIPLLCTILIALMCILFVLYVPPSYKTFPQQKPWQPMNGKNDQSGLIL